MSIGAASFTRPGETRSGPAGPRVWQRTDTVGTELVFQAGSDPRTATGYAVVAGPLPHTTRFHAELDARWAVHALTVTCDGAGWSRELQISRNRDGRWACHTEQNGELPQAPAAGGHPTPPAAGIDDPDRLTGADVLRLSDSPIFVTWALRHLRLATADRPTNAATIRVLTPSLVVLSTRSAYQLVSEHRLRISGGERPTTYEIDHTGLVLTQPARLRLAR